MAIDPHSKSHCWTNRPAPGDRWFIRLSKTFLKAVQLAQDSVKQQCGSSVMSYWFSDATGWKHDRPLMTNQTLINPHCSSLSAQTTNFHAASQLWLQLGASPTMDCLTHGGGKKRNPHIILHLRLFFGMLSHAEPQPTARYNLSLCESTKIAHTHMSYSMGNDMD